MVYIVQGMKLIPQTTTMGCWYASAQMLVNWRRNRYKMTEANMPDPSEDAGSSWLLASNSGIQNPAILPMAKRLGLVPVPPISPTRDAIDDWLRKYGPLWVNGRTHIVVIAGIGKNKVLVYDPSPVNVGSVGWRSLSWYVGNSASSRDTGADVKAVFLHCPR